MNTYFSLMISPFVVALSVLMFPWLGGLMMSHEEPIQIKELVLPTGLNDVVQRKEVGVEVPMRLEALMPSFVVDRYVVHKGIDRQQQAGTVLRLSSTLVTDTKRSAILNGEVVVEGQRIGPYRIQKIYEDRLMVVGQRGREFVYLPAREAQPLFDVPVSSKGAVVSLPPGKSPNSVDAPAPLPASELERQFRKLLENFSH